jgi:putative DNA primase/helicase
VQQVIEHLASEGYTIGEFIADGKIRRFALDEKDSKRSGWYKAYTNYAPDNGEPYYVVAYGDWRSDERKKYCSLSRKLPSAQNRLHKEQYEKAKREADAERATEHERVAKNCADFWETLEHTGASPYLDRKQISGELGIRYRELNKCVYVPVRDIDGKIWSLEEINEEGKKLSWAGGRKVGGFHIIGQLGDVVYLAEGFATAASIQLATGHGCVCTFGTGQFKAVASIFRKRYPDKKIVICGDLNHPSKKSASEKLAEDAAKLVGGFVLFPKFKNSTDEDFPTDFNDLYCREGAEEVKRQLETSHDLAPLPLSGTEIVNNPFPDEDEKGKRLGTLENLKELLRRLNIRLRYNGIKKKEEVLIPGLTTSVDNHENVTLSNIISWCERCKISSRNVQGYLTSIADGNLYNPVATWIESEPWDGNSRLQEFYDTLDAPGCVLKETLIRRWLISAIAAAYEPNGVSAHGVLVLQGAQYVGKTRWFKALAPKELGVLKEGAILAPSDKDSVFQSVSNWIVELGELDATFKKSDISQLKAFITKSSDVMRRPFDRRDSSYARRTVFFGSVNEETYLNDPTGNRRFWTIGPHVQVNSEHGINMQQLWAEARELYRAGEQWWLTNEEMRELNMHNEQFEAVDPIEELIQSKFDWNDPRRVEYTATEVLELAGAKSPTTKDLRTAGRICAKLSGVPMHRSNGRRLYSVPPQLLRREEKYSVQN